jgi:hypothetical protein
MIASSVPGRTPERRFETATTMRGMGYDRFAENLSGFHGPVNPKCDLCVDLRSTMLIVE